MNQLLRLFIIEDEEIIRWGLVNDIPWNDWGYTVVGEAGNGKIALELIPEKKPDVLLLDMKMPVMNGIDFMEAIHSTNPSIKLVILSGYNEFEYARKGIQYGVFAYLLKPAKDSDIIDTFLKLRTVLDHSGDTSNKSPDLHHRAPALMPDSAEHGSSLATPGPDGSLESLLPQGEPAADEADYLTDRMNPIILKVKKYLKENFANKISLENLAELAHMNASYFSTYFKQKTGCSYKDYLTLIRIEEAKKLLANKELKVYTISLMVGYDDFRYFCRLFKEATGMSTMQYRSHLM